MHTDSLLYRLFQERPALAFALAGITLPEAAAYRMQATEVKQTAFRLDGGAATAAGVPRGADHLHRDPVPRKQELLRAVAGGHLSLSVSEARDAPLAGGSRFPPIPGSISASHTL